MLELVIPPTTGWVAQWESASHVMGLSRVRYLVWPILFSSYKPARELPTKGVRGTGAAAPVNILR